MPGAIAYALLAIPIAFMGGLVAEYADYAKRTKRIIPWLLALTLVTCVLACKRPAPAERDAVQTVDAMPVASASTSATASASAVANGPPPAPVAYVAPDAGVATWETMMRFAKERVAKAKAHELELVRMPIHMHGPGWGCTCPSYYAGAQETASQTETVFLDPTFESAAAPIAMTETRIAEGYFTGKTTPSDGDPGIVYTLYGFRVLRTRIATDAELEPENFRASVIASGASAGLERPAPDDKRVFLLIEASFPLGPGADDAAKKRADKFRAHYPSIEVVDSRTVPGLFCCNDVVVLDRFATQAEAAAEEKRAKSIGAKATIRRGW